MREKDFNSQRQEFQEMFAKFLEIAVKVLELDSLPEFHFEAFLDHPDQPTFGMYVNGENKLYVGLSGRHPNDIFRTIAHELTHYKQDTEHKLNADSGQTGSPEENQANAMAGIIMRIFNKTYPDYIRSKPVMEGEPYSPLGNFADGQNPQATNQESGPEWESKLMDVWSPKASRYMARVVKQSFNSLYPDVKLKVWAEDEGVTATTDLASANVKADVFGQYGKKDWECNFFCGPLFYHADGRKYLELMVEDAASGSYPGVWRIILSEWKKWASGQLKKTGADDVCFSVDEDMSGGAWEKVAGAVGIKFIARDLDEGYRRQVENFADGKNPQDKGDSKRHGIKKGISIAQLKKIRSSDSASPRKKQLAHWQINMRQGLAKKS